jgi:hypothetical protein
MNASTRVLVKSTDCAAAGVTAPPSVVSTKTRAIKHPWTKVRTRPRAASIIFNITNFPTRHAP